jgi:hypothetical protein
MQDTTPGRREREKTEYALAELAGALAMAPIKDPEIKAVLALRNQGFKAPLDEAALDDVVKRARKAKRQAREADAQKLLAEMNAKHAVVGLGGKQVIMNRIYDHEVGREGVTFSGPADLKLMYANTWHDGDTYDKFWISHPLRRQYSQIVFEPGLAAPPETYNLWRGWSVEPKPGNCDLFLRHIWEVLAGQNEDIYNYLLDWCAQLVQQPQVKPGVALVLRGLQGTGKGTFVDALGRLCAAHYLQITNSSHLLNKFNSHMKTALLVFADEAVWAGDKAGEGVLKAMITEKFSQVEHKGKDSVQLRNYIRLIMSSNADWVAPVEKDDRRYFVLDVRDHHKEDAKWFGAIQRELDGGGLGAFLHLLMERDISRVNIRKFPQTAAIVEQKINSMDPLSSWWYDLLQDGEATFPTRAADMQRPSSSMDSEWWVDTAAAFDHYQEYVKRIGRRSAINPQQFGIQLKRLVPPLERERKRFGGGLTYGYVFPSIRECRKWFDSIMKCTLDWQKFDD